MICGQCLFYLDIAYSFRNECEFTDKKLRDLLTQDKGSFYKNESVNNTKYYSSLENDDDQVQNLNLDQTPLNHATNLVDSNETKQLEETIHVEYSASAKNDDKIVLEDAHIFDTKKSGLDINIPKSLQENCILNKNNCPQDPVVIKEGERLEQENAEETNYPETIKRSENSKAKVGRHIAKKITGKLPQRLHQNSSGVFDDRSQNCENNLNSKIVLKDVYLGTKFEDEIMRFEEVLESNMPVVVSEETVVTEDSFSYKIDCTHVNETQEKTVGIDCGDHYVSSSEKLKRKIVRKKLKISPKLKMTLRKGNRKVNVFMNRHKDSIRKKKKITKIHTEQSTEETGDEKTEKLKNEFKCDICNKQFPFRSHLKRHLNKHTGAKLYSCEFCEQKFVNNYNLNVHMSKHTGDFRLKCDICNKGLPNPSLLKRHMTSHTGEQKFQCRYCSVKFRQSSSLRSHEKMHINRPSYHCDICFKVFSYTNSLTAHKKIHFGSQRFSCDICLSTFSRKSSLIRHMGEHTKSKRIKCKLCNLSFHSKSNYNSHLKTHSKYKCDTCGEGFRYKSNFTEHVKCHKG